MVFTAAAAVLAMCRIGGLSHKALQFPCTGVLMSFDSARLSPRPSSVLHAFPVILSLSQCSPLSIYCYCDPISPPLSLSLCSTTAAPSITHMQAHTHTHAERFRAYTAKDRGLPVTDGKKCVSFTYSRIHH